MLGLDNLSILFVVTAFLFQAVLIAHFALRKWRFNLAVRYGWLVYALGVPAAGVSLVLLWRGASWTLWPGGFLYLIWAAVGYTVEYLLGIQWRSPPRWPIVGLYVTLFLATIMFYWWPLATLYRPLWYVYALLFVVSTALNLTSHQGKRSQTANLG